MPLTARPWFSVYIPPNHSARGRAASIGLRLLCACATLRTDTVARGFAS
ncbi:hypothetical protein [Paenibacillus sp. S02]|nr:hypothetical protein [Paenibacillus sp. S02]